MSRGEVEVVFFDVGGTLWWAEPSADEILSRALLEHGYRVRPSTIVRRVGSRGPELNRNDIVRALEETRQGLRSPLPRNREEEKAYFRHFDVMVLEKLGIPPQEEVLESISRNFRHGVTIHPFDEAHETLEALEKMGYPMGVISNATHDLSDRLQSVNLLQFFDSVTYSYEVGVEKPDPRIFHVALERMDVEASRAVHIGDDYEADVVGSMGVGMTAFLLDRDRNFENKDCIIIRNLHDAVRHL